MVVLCTTILMLFASVAMAAYQKVADNTVPAYHNAELTNRTGNERVDKGDLVTVLEERSNAYYVRYPVKNGTKDRWVPKNIFNNTGHNPEGWLDVVASNGNNQITVKGWALDRDNVNEQIRVHIYIGGPAGSGEGHEIYAKTHRPDVNQALGGVGDYHGFEATINTNRTGNQAVYAYGINIGGGENKELSGSPKNVNINTQSFQQYQDTAKQTVPAYTNAALNQRNGNERVDAGDRVTVLNKQGDAFYVDYPAGNTRKQRWVHKSIFEDAPMPSGKLLYPLKGRSISYSSSRTTNGQRCDYVAPSGTALYAPADGTVKFMQSYAVNYGKLASYANQILFTSSDNKYTVRCAHLSSFNGVSLKYSQSLKYPCSSSTYSCSTITLATRNVKRGELLGYTGMTGNASGPHLHIEVKENGRAVAPVDVFATW